MTLRAFIYLQENRALSCLYICVTVVMLISYIWCILYSYIYVYLHVYYFILWLLWIDSTGKGSPPQVIYLLWNWPYLQIQKLLSSWYRNKHVFLTSYQLTVQETYISEHFVNEIRGSAPYFYFLGLDRHSIFIQIITFTKNPALKLHLKKWYYEYGGQIVKILGSVDHKSSLSLHNLSFWTIL